MRSLDRCDSCNVGRFTTTTSRTEGSRRKRYLKCKSCGATSKEICAIDAVGRVLYSVDTKPSTSGGHNAASQAYYG